MEVNLELQPTVWLCPLQLPDKGLLVGPPTEPPILLQCQNGESAPLGSKWTHCSHGPALECASHFSTLPETQAMLLKTSFLLHTGSDPCADACTFIQIAKKLT